MTVGVGWPSVCPRPTRWDSAVAEGYPCVDATACHGGSITHGKEKACWVP